MQELDDNALLREYVERDSEDAFAALVTRHVNKVYSVALRHTRNPHQAEEITQAVFVILAKKSHNLGRGVVLSGWLYQTARLTAVTFIKSEIRRARREEAHMQNLLSENESDAWPQIIPLLDSAMAGLNKTDRHAVVLRFFDGRSMRDVGSALGASEDAAKKRVNRAVEKLRLFFTKRGIVLSATTLTAAISANSVQAAPIALAKTATAVALAQGAAVSGSTLTLIQGALKVMAWTKARTGVVSAVVAACVVLPLVTQHKAQARVREQDALLRQQAEQVASQQAENQRLSRLVASSSLSEERLNALAKLRNEVPELQQQTTDVSKLQEENRRLQRAVNKPKTPMQLKEEAVAKLSYGKNWVVAFYQFAEKNQGQFPSSFDQAAAFLPGKARKESNLTTDQFEIVFHGAPSSLKKPKDIILLREKEAWNAGETSHAPGRWVKTYVFADGHSELHHETENNFDAYERAHIVSPEKP